MEGPLPPVVAPLVCREFASDEVRRELWSAIGTELTSWATAGRPREGAGDFDEGWTSSSSWSMCMSLVRDQSFGEATREPPPCEEYGDTRTE